MKHPYHSFLVFILAVICGCSKSGNDAANDAYSVTGITDITVPQYADTTVNVLYHIALPVRVNEPVTFNIGDLPPGVTVSPATAIDTTSFSIRITYHIRMTAVASFPVTVSLFSASAGKKSFTFNIIVTKGTPFSYTVNNLPDINIPLYSDTILRVPVTAVYHAGINEQVSINADGLPAGVTVSPGSVTGMPAFTDTFSFHVIANTIGAFPVTLHTTSSSSGTRASSFSINTVAGADCAPPLAGNYSNNTVCTSYKGAGTGISTGQVYISGTNKLFIHLPIANVAAYINCGNGTISIEPAASGSYAITAGVGTFNATNIILNYTLAGSINSNCTTTLTR